ncbi:hypothetical protein N7532_001032 [Penicillium argentinense]|uniref:Uncharacterized protein n=1 Tax=Penicillium argentinense TaxID=1131581 RepID=A0A9W9G389_9EURO|nr:uncharacterized protein N7532_001032 [Penicillium argentinense]KAJ5110497.1 hypothetical protein N7532_001032 [Penicillium argentinense]
MQSITADRDIGSSQDFGNRVQSLFEPRCNTSTTRATTFKSTRETLFPQTRPSLQLSGQAANELKAHVILPSEEDAFQLLDTIMLYFYEPQHLFDARDVSDRISSFFESGNPQLQDSNIWTLQIFLIFALGKLLRGDTSSDDQLPGLHYFSYVERVLPPLTELRKHGLAAIEVLALMVVYLQNADRKEDAAIYVSLPTSSMSDID